MPVITNLGCPNTRGQQLAEGWTIGKSFAPWNLPKRPVEGGCEDCWKMLVMAGKLLAAGALVVEKVKLLLGPAIITNHLTILPTASCQLQAKAVGRVCEEKVPLQADMICEIELTSKAPSRAPPKSHHCMESTRPHHHAELGNDARDNVVLTQNLSKSCCWVQQCRRSRTSSRAEPSCRSQIWQSQDRGR